MSKERRPGKTTVVTVRHEDGSGAAYSKPEPVEGGDPVYRKLAAEYWVNGWSAVLDGSSLAFWLVLMDETNSGDKKTGVWLSESQTEAKYSISPYLRQAALRQLQAAGLIDAKRIYAREAFAVTSSRTEMKVAGGGLIGDPLQGLGSG